MRQGVKRYHNGWCADTLGGLFEKSLILAHFIDDVFFWYKVKFPVLGLVFSSSRLSGFLNYQILNQRKFAVCCEMSHYFVWVLTVAYYSRLPGIWASDWDQQFIMNRNEYMSTQFLILILTGCFQIFCSVRLFEASTALVLRILCFLDVMQYSMVNWFCLKDSSAVIFSCLF